MKLLDKFHENVKNMPNHVAYSDETDIKDYTLQYVEEISSKVYTYLLSQRIQKEDIIAIDLPRSARIPIVIIGILKSGAAFSVLGNRSDEETRKFIIKDLNPKLTINMEIYNYILTLDPTEGYKEPDNNDLAYIVYSSGSSGHFKGSMHEYGSLEILFNKLEKLYEFYEEHYGNEGIHTRMGIQQGLYAISSIATIFNAMYSGDYIYIVPYDIVNDYDLLDKKLTENKITQTLYAPIYFKDGRIPKNPYLKYLTIVFEPYDNILLPGIQLFNCYGLTESVAQLTEFEIDKKYDITPVGKPINDTNIFILNEIGKQISIGEIGEIVFESQYFRGYRNLPELTKKVLKDGLFYTGDMATYDENENIVVLGRKCDILKKNGNYIIPIKIVAAAKKILNLSWAYVKVFENKTPTICLYYVDNIELDINTVRNKLKNILNNYELPTNVVKLDEIPCFASGKINRTKFANPLED